MTLSDVGGIVGVVMMLTAYALAQLGRMKVDQAPSLLTNLVGSLLVLVSLLAKFNLSAFLMEAAWAVVALFGLMKLALKKRG
ncbi:MAG TPA: hypothetical protein VGM25_08735 [Caulobacteraceae bacterium]|jgi:hypothetical protein